MRRHMRKGKREKYRMQKSHQKEERQDTENSNLPMFLFNGERINQLVLDQRCEEEECRHCDVF